MRKDFVAVMMRHFKLMSFPLDTVHFRFDGTLFPIVRVDHLGIHYGKQPWLMNASEKGYHIRKVHVKQSILGRGCIFDIRN